MQRDTRLVTVHYRKLMRDNDRLLPGRTLSDAVGQALLSDPYAADWQRRVTQALDNSGVSRFVNNSHTDMASTFGDLCSFTHAEMQAVISTGQTATPTVNIADIRAPSGSDYLHGIAYWLLVGDHCYVIQHSSVRTKALESYLAWLLRKAGLLQSDHQITLQAAFDVLTASPDVGDVTGIEIGGIVPERLDAPLTEHAIDSREIEVQRSLEKRAPTLQVGLTWLQALFGPTEADRIMSQIPRGAAVKVTLRLGYVALKRHLSRRAMDHLAVAARNLDDGEVRIRGRNGRISGNEARLHSAVQVKLVRANGHLLDFVDVHEQLENVHSRFLEEGRITAS